MLLLHELQQLLCLQSIRMLQDASSSLYVGNNSNCVAFLQSKAAMLKFVKPKLHYTADRIVGNAELLTCTECQTEIKHL